jgi:exopolyphosphatase / guanosine-5'-triphosphate,3'-diphosphate pyrophosphatase
MNNISLNYRAMKQLRNENDHLAAIDLGTNSFHMVIVKIDKEKNSFKVVDRVKENVRLGSGSSDMKYLTEEAMVRGIESLRRFKKVADAYEAPIRAIATSAVREALNQNEFIRRVYAELDLKIEVASGFEEARLIYLGIIQALPLQNKSVLMIDIGGGSTEYLVGKKREIFYENSLKLGAIRLTQRFFTGEELTEEKIKECRKYVAGNLAPVVRQMKKSRHQTVVGSSGTITALARIIRLQRGDLNDTSMNGFVFTSKELTEAVALLCKAKTVKQRMKIAGLDAARADIIVSGAIILEQSFKHLRIKQMTVSEFALREGIILDTIEKKYNVKDFHALDNIRYKSVLHLAETFRYEKEHSHHVANLAIKIFDQTQSLHKLGRMERDFLEAAAILHEIGIFLSHAQHHRHAHYLIKNSELLGYSDNEKELIGNIARYHRKSHPKPKHEGFALLNNEDQNIVKMLSSMIRIADGLDRTHSSAVKDLKVKKSGKTVKILLRKAKGKNLEMEMWGADRKKELFEEVFDVNVQFM